MSSAGAQAVTRALPCGWPCRPSAWASIGLIWAISSCALRRSWNGSHRVMVAIWSPSCMGRAARRLGEDADPGWLNGVHLLRNYVQDNLNIVYLSRSAFNTTGNHQDHRHPKAHPATGWWPSFFAALKIEFVER